MSDSIFQHSSSVDLDFLVNPTPGSSYFLRVSGNSMTQAGILDGSIILVDRALSFRDGDIVVAELNGEFTVKYLYTTPSMRLVPANPKYPVIYVGEYDTLEIFGVVATSIRRLK